MTYKIWAELSKCSQYSFPDMAVLYVVPCNAVERYDDSRLHYDDIDEVPWQIGFHIWKHHCTDTKTLYVFSEYIIGISIDYSTFSPASPTEWDTDNTVI